MGLRFFFGSILVLSLLFRPSRSLEPNTDFFCLSNLLKLTNLTSSQLNLSADVCVWPGVFCDAQRKHILELNLAGMGLSGSIPDDTIGKLSELQLLNLSNNNIAGLPSDFYSLGSLRTLDLSSNQISGNLPSNIGDFGSLESLDLSCNNLSGEIPASISSLVSLQVLKLDRNGLESSIPSAIRNCQSLVLIDLSSNRLTGELPLGFLAAFPKLRTLNLAGNQIERRDLEFLGIKSIANLNISNNLFNGSVMGAIPGSLEAIDLSRNQFEGQIFEVNANSSFFNSSRLVYLDLSENQLSGEFSRNLSQFGNLKHLNLANNQFIRPDFGQISTLVGLEYLNLSRTSLQGRIPPDFSKLGGLKVVDLSQNHLSGQIPSVSAKNLETFDVSHNNLSGQIPPSLVRKLPQMERFNFSCNHLILCISEISNDTFRTAFLGSSNSCPIAANSTTFKRSNKNKGFLLSFALTLSMVCLVVGLLVLAFGCRRRSRMCVVKPAHREEEEIISGPFSFQTDSTTWVADVKQARSVPVVIFEKPLLNFTFADLLLATSNFDRDTLLSEGRFGPVYRGFLPGGMHVAVKVLVHGSILTDPEAAGEFEHLGRIKHMNLVPLAGYCLAGEQRIAIYDYMDNGNLHNLLHDLPLGIQTSEDWAADTWEEDDAEGITRIGSEGLLATWRFRHRIALGTARALAFLHHGCSPPVIHRDVRASSVYLDSNLEPRLSDFGLAKIFANGLDDEIFHGSPGYAPPEFSDAEPTSPRDPTPKTDVYGYGVILFELITGKKPVGDDYPDRKESSLVSWARRLVRANEGSKAIDPKLRGSSSDAQAEEALKIGYLCTADLPAKRPSMQQVVGLLKDIEPAAALQ